MALSHEAGRSLAKMQMQLQLRRSMSTRATAAAAAAAAASSRAAKPSAPARSPAAAGQQKRLLQGVTATSTSTGSVPPIMMLRPEALGHSEEAAARVAAAGLGAEPATVAQYGIVEGVAVNDGRQVELEFADGSRYMVHSSWLKDSNPSKVGPDFYRTSAADVWKLRDFTVSQVLPLEGGERLEVTYNQGTESELMDTFESRWLHAFAPFVGKALHADASAAAAPSVSGTGSLTQALVRNRKGWRCEVDMPMFDAEALVQSEDLQVEFLEKMIDPGIALITGVGKPTSLDREFAGKLIEDLTFKIIGKFNQHPVRSTTYGVMRKTAESAKQGADYDMSNPLSMHTDHSVYHGTPGYLQFLYQAEGSVRSKVCDGLALAEYVKEHHPRAYELLTTVEMTHSSRNTLYTREGAPRSVYDKSTAPAPFELVHTHPIICLDSEGLIEKVVQSETKRGVCALPYDVYEEFMEAYELWTQLCEDDRFIKHFDWPEGTAVVTNNWRTMHGRANVPAGMARTMAFGYVNKILVENRYRYLKQRQTQRASPSMDHRWLTRVPNQVLERMTVASTMAVE